MQQSLTFQQVLLCVNCCKIYNVLLLTAVVEAGVDAAEVVATAVAVNSVAETLTNY